MKSFNVREVSRSTAEVLAACERDGGVIIRYQDGRQHELAPRRAARKGRGALPDFRARQKAIFGKKQFASHQINAFFEVEKSTFRPTMHSKSCAIMTTICRTVFS